MNLLKIESALCSFNSFDSLLTCSIFPPECNSSNQTDGDLPRCSQLHIHGISLPMRIVIGRNGRSLCFFNDLWISGGYDNGQEIVRIETKMNTLNVHYPAKTRFEKALAAP